MNSCTMPDAKSRCSKDGDVGGPFLQDKLSLLHPI